ncbi:zinc finger and BTB domain-containing protein 41-like isoform X1 [Pectinophora gossypiella]|uniref:zinc finger and BTB domain-containing protein 41-like isoform X1 n=1 Tax=Pectinophora gossypiella TaxID=13191 RepID=UPI00214E92A4|nr:zinc finger and BTB domain-containing protein 41-like isoform X1 [Pectinophora gossypiella]XP_049883304.1 zinc finger and BTB domain-containing protein 41-like isoform X1 [Pectinophora gossypiella]XP_049883305.1 zinc finger and BTB domain-containing protein 41-like isoform X1 [Pectinophora gossypiella]XP_049883306.1 zinc finger and BTB domain-containing protein 41-like isoform X1 [Pectinophora gossypiella]XP_049883307.1 zinc finger and BTB domain-containing protein 41-like isoform X1 [Pectin
MRYFDKCRCCLEDGELKELWAEYVDDGGTEIYGQMLNECFSFSWQESTDYSEQICESCIKRLRDAMVFRQEAMSAKQILDEIIKQNIAEAKLDSKPIKIEVLEDFQESDGDNEENLDHEQMVQQYMQHEYIEEGETNESLEDEQESQGCVDQEREYVDCSSQSEGQPDVDMQVEYLEDDSEAQTVLSQKRKWPKKRKKGERLKVYKNYTRTDLMNAIEMVLSNKMTRAEAAAQFNVPVKTLGAKLRMKEAAGDSYDDPETKSQSYKFYEEIRMILTYTNATPYKSKVSRFFCAYCGTDGPLFEDPVLLRTHTRSQHAQERIKNIEMFMRPFHMNEIIKLDIDKLQCTVCTVGIEDWNAMFTHLQEQHGVTLDAAYTKAIPYVLKDDLRCALCSEKFSHFHLLDYHMNAHYGNYICGECGDTFLAENRLKSHVETHSKQRFPCNECGKVFTLEKYRKKHYEGVHLKERKFKCSYCPEVFTGDYLRHAHVLAQHKEKIKLIHCEFCKMTFTWRPYYLKHVRLNHRRPERRFKCKLCSKCFHQKHELKNHEDWHQGNGYTCPVCDKKFSSKRYLQKHTMTHGDSTFVVIVNNGEGKEVIEGQ